MSNFEDDCIVWNLNPGHSQSVGQPGLQKNVGGEEACQILDEIDLSTFLKDLNIFKRSTPFRSYTLCSRV